jgi:hypothetical protein
MTGGLDLGPSGKGVVQLDDVGGPDEAHRAGLFGRVRPGQGILSRIPRGCTDFPVPLATGLGRKAAALREGHGVGLLEGERPLHVVAEPPHGHALRPGPSPPRSARAGRRGPAAPGCPPSPRTTRPFGRHGRTARSGRPRARGARGRGHGWDPFRDARARRPRGCGIPARCGSNGPRPGRAAGRRERRDAVPFAHALTLPRSPAPRPCRLLSSGWCSRRSACRPRVCSEARPGRIAPCHRRPSAAPRVRGTRSASGR